MNIKERVFRTSNSFAFLPLRLAVGGVMAAHGSQKLFGWFGGSGLEKTGQHFADNIGLEPGLLMAVMAGGTEFFGGVLLVLGLLTRVAGLAIAATMAVAIVMVHSDAFFAGNQGMEYPLTLLLAALALVIGGGGALSVDRSLAKHR